MGIHHVALATPDMATTHAFYSEAMGFEVAKVVTAPTPGSGDGWARHVFYDTGSTGMIAFWDIHDPGFPEINGGMSRSVGLPEWVNHLAFHATDDAHYESAKKRWAELGLDIVEVDHGFCRSIYTMDPNGTMVEWCHDTRELDEADRRSAAAALALMAAGGEPTEFDPSPRPEFVPGERDKRPSWMTW